MVTAAASFAAYHLSRQGAGTLAQDRTAATIALTVAAFGVLTALARPMTWWKYLLIGGMMAAFALVFAVPALRAFFALPLHDTRHRVSALAAGAAGWVAIEMIARVTRGRRPAS